MKITVINGTPVKGVTYRMKELFLKHIKGEKEITQFYPRDFPPFCTGCKNCFVKGEDRCPHSRETGLIWDSMMEADLLVFAYPVYALRAPASIKSVLDHLCVRWMVHRPEPAIFKKTAVIITNSVGAPNGSAQKDVKTSLSFMGVSNIYTCGAGMMGDIFVEKLSKEHQQMLIRKMDRLAEKVNRLRPRSRKSMKVSILFSMCKLMNRKVMSSGAEPGLDQLHYRKNGWLS